MSRASRMAAAGTRIASRAPQLGLNSAGVPGGVGATPLDRDVDAAGLTWPPTDAGPWDAPIGYALATSTLEDL